MRLIFPHISRIFSARIFLTAGKITLWSLLLALLGANIFAAANNPLDYTNKLYAVFTHPFSWTAHADLALDFWRLGWEEPATQELVLANELYEVNPRDPASAGKQILGVEASPADLLATWQNEPLRQQEALRYWQEIIKDHPDYRDAYVALAAILYKQGNIDEAKTFLSRAVALDPNNPISQKLMEFIAQEAK